MVSIVEIILAVSAGLRNAVQMTMCPRRIRSVSAASADNDVNDSKVISSVGRGMVWKWSYSQIDSKPRRSACRATSVVRRHASSGSKPSYSPTQPCGTTTPSFIAHLPVRCVYRPAMPDLTIRRAETDADLEAWTRVRRIVVPDEPSATIEQMRSMAAEPDRVFFLAELDGETVGSGVASDSNLADGFAMPRILPEHRRHGFGSAILEALLDHHVAVGRRTVSSRAEDDAALAFATHHGFVEFDRQIEQVRTILPVEPEPPPYPGVEFTTVAADPDCSSAPTPWPPCRAMRIWRSSPVQPMCRSAEWLRDEATLPGGSIVAIADGEIVGWAGLTAWNDDDTRAENGLTVVDRAWRGRVSGPPSSAASSRGPPPTASARS